MPKSCFRKSAPRVSESECPLCKYVNFTQMLREGSPNRWDFRVPMRKPRQDLERRGRVWELRGDEHATNTLKTSTGAALLRPGAPNTASAVFEPRGSENLGSGGVFELRVGTHGGNGGTVEPRGGEQLGWAMCSSPGAPNTSTKCIFQLATYSWRGWLQLAN